MHNIVCNSIGSSFQTNGAAFLKTLPDSTVLLIGAASKELLENLSDLPGIYSCRSPLRSSGV